MLKLCLKTRFENAEKIGLTQPWCPRQMHAERPLKSESSVCHRSSPVQARDHSVYYTVHSHSGIYQSASSYLHYIQEWRFFWRNVIFHHLKTNLSFISRKSFPRLFCILYRWQETLSALLNLHLHTALKIIENLF